MLLRNVSKLKSPLLTTNNNFFKNKASFSTFSHPILNYIQQYKTVNPIKSTYNYNFYKNSFNFYKTQVFKLKTTSNASRNSFKLKQFLKPKNGFLQKKHFSLIRKKRGKSQNGIVCRTKSRLLKKFKYPVYVKSVRTTALSLNAGFYTLPFKFKNYCSYSIFTTHKNKHS